jgi:hypothetical protein
VGGGLDPAPPIFECRFSPASQRGLFWTVAAGIGETEVAALSKQIQLALFYDAKLDLVP